MSTTPFDDFDSQYKRRLSEAFRSIFEPTPPMTQQERIEHRERVRRQHARDEAARTAPQQDALPLA